MIDRNYIPMRKVDRFATTASGIPGIDDLRWGSHICQWYCKRGDLADTLVPYFEAGLQNNERCIWLTAPPYEMAGAKHDLERTVAGLDQMIADRQLRIHGNSLRGINVVEHWLVEEREALAAGYNGIRIASNTSFVSEDDWRIFIDYENAFNRELLHEHRIVALCSYNLLDVTPTKMFDAVHNHHVTIHKAGADWTALEM
jgi:hypothetical protein